MYISIIVVLIIGIVSVSNVYATTNSTSNVNVPLYRQIEKLIENPFFAPDASCMFDAYQLHCIPGDHQECPEGFASNEDSTCFVSKKNGCPDGYHSADDDETGQCYPDTEPCYPGDIRVPDYPTCGHEERVCEEYNITGCTIDGIMLEDYPDEYCLTSPDQDNCAIIEGVGCPEGFATMNSANFTIQRCVPESVEDVEKAERERQVLNPNRCAIGYKLNVQPSVDIHRRGDNIGSCIKQD